MVRWLTLTFIVRRENYCGGADNGLQITWSVEDIESREGEGHADEVHKPPRSISVLRNLRLTNCGRTTGTGAPDPSALKRRCTLFQVQFSKIWMPARNLRKLGSSVSALVLVGKAWFQEREVGSCEDGGWEVTG